jgi:hypothetical protein
MFIMKAEVETNNGRGRLYDTFRGWFETDVVQHWTLYVDDEWLADTSDPDTAERFKKIAKKINER